MLAKWVVDDDRLAAGDRLNRMSCVGWNDSDEAGSHAPGHAVDRDLQFAFDDLPHLFFKMEMLMNRRACVEFVVRESHAGRIKITASPPGLAFDHRQLVGIDECHVGKPVGRSAKRQVKPGTSYKRATDADCTHGNGSDYSAQCLLHDEPSSNSALPLVARLDYELDPQDYLVKHP